VLDDVMYKSIAVGFAFFTIATVLGALWAAEAWGGYWSWDPKETWALIVWLNYAAWLHMRLMKGLRGTVSAWWALVGLAVTTFAFLGVNMFLSGCTATALCEQNANGLPNVQINTKQPIAHADQDPDNDGFITPFQRDHAAGGLRRPARADEADGHRRAGTALAGWASAKPWRSPARFRASWRRSKAANRRGRRGDHGKGHRIQGRHSYNNYYEFGTDKADPAKNAHTLKTARGRWRSKAWSRSPASTRIEDLLKLSAQEERIYRLRCVEGWSMVIPWVGYSLAELIKRSSRSPQRQVRRVRDAGRPQDHALRRLARARLAVCPKACAWTKPCIR
jgi:hypothetical protein